MTNNASIAHGKHNIRTVNILNETLEVYNLESLSRFYCGLMTHNGKCNYTIIAL